MPDSQARSPNVHDASNAGLLESFPDPQIEEAQFPLFGPQLYETDDQSPLVDPYENVDYGLQSRSNYSAEEPPYTPRIDGAQYNRPWPSPSGEQNYLVGPPQENDVFQTGEDPGSHEGAFQQQGNYMEAISAHDFGDASGHTISWRSLDILSPEIGSHRIDHVSRNLPDATFQTARRPSIEHYPLLQTNNPGIAQMPSGSGAFATQMSTRDCQLDPLEQVSTGGLVASLVSPFTGRVFDWTNGNEKNHLVGINRSLSVDPGFPTSTTSRAQNSHISPISSEPRRKSDSSYHPASTVQPLAQRTQRGTKSSQPLAQDWSVRPSRMRSSGKDDFA